MRPIAMTLCAAVGTVAPLLGQFGELPPGPLMTERYGGVRVEIVVRYFVTPRLVIAQLPPGLRPQLRRAPGDSADRAQLTLSIVAADTIDVGGTRVRPSSQGWAVDAGLWTRVDSSTVPRDPRTHGDRDNVALVTWKADAGIVQRLRAIGVPAKTGCITVDSVAGGWTFELAVDGARVTGRCMLTGASRALSYPVPAFETVWQADHSPMAFIVYTYFGHYIQPCNPQVSFQGSYSLLRPLDTSASVGSGLVGHVETHWAAQAGIYR